MQQAVRRARVDSPARWDSALTRAVENGIEVFTVNDTGEWMTTSASKPDTLHRTCPLTCSCEAAVAGDPVCQHRAAIRFVLGWFEPRPAVAVDTCECAKCNGRGWAYVESRPDTIPYKSDCVTCQGSGRVALPAKPGRVADTSQDKVVAIRPAA